MQDGEVTKITNEDSRMEALTAVGIIDAEGNKSTRKDIQQLKEALIRTMKGDCDEIPNNILTQDAKTIDRANRLIMRFDEKAGRTNWTPAPVCYETGVSDDIAELFCHAIAIPPPEITTACLDDLLVNLSQIFELQRKASFTRVPEIFNKATAHVSSESADYEKFKQAIDTARCVVGKVVSSPANEMGKILAEARMMGVNQGEIERFMTAREALIIDEDMGELGNLADERATEEVTLYVEHGEQLEFNLL